MRCNNGSENLVVRWWYAGKVKPHPRYLECGFIVTPTESLNYDTCQSFKIIYCNNNSMYAKSYPINIQVVK